MQMIENYLHNFENHLSVANRKEIREELGSSILDQIDDKEEQLSRSLNEQEIEELLLNLGHPMKVAAGFSPNQQLVSTEYFPAYKKVLTIALWIYAILTILRMLPFNISLSDGSLIIVPFAIFWALAETSVWVFTCVTFVFYLLQKYSTNIDFIYAWSPKQLSRSGKKLSLSRVETGFEIIFLGLFLAWWNSLFSSQSTFLQGNAVQNIVMAESMLPLLWPINILCVLSIAVALYNLVIAGWSRHTLILNILLGFANLGVIAIMLQFEQYATIELAEEYGLVLQRFAEYLTVNIRIALTIIAGLVIWDIFSSILKLKNS
jgi:hypothetical protein